MIHEWISIVLGGWHSLPMSLESALFWCGNPEGSDGAHYYAPAIGSFTLMVALIMFFGSRWYNTPRNFVWGALLCLFIVRFPVFLAATVILPFATIFVCHMLFSAFVSIWNNCWQICEYTAVKDFVRTRFVPSQPENRQISLVRGNPSSSRGISKVRQ